MAKTSAYGATAVEICELFGDYLQGDATCYAFVMSSSTLSELARDAIEKSMQAFGYDEGGCAFTTLTPTGADAQADAITLDASAVFMLVEGLDPLFVIATDAQSCSALGAAYRSDVPLDSPTRLFGRPAAGFADLDQLLQTPQGKQRAWKVLKTLPL